MLDKTIYTLHASRHTYTGTAQELEAIMMSLKRDAREQWAKWSKMNTVITQAVSRST